MAPELASCYTFCPKRADAKSPESARSIELMYSMYTLQMFHDTVTAVWDSQAKFSVISDRFRHAYHQGKMHEVSVRRRFNKHTPYNSPTPVLLLQ